MFRNVPPEQALKRLIEGNQLYASDRAAETQHAHAVHRRHDIATQRPFAIILGCSDSRVPVEIIFSQTLGDLFVIRNAGYVLNDHVTGSIEYAVHMFGSSLIMVLGHSSCGAVTAAVEATLHHAEPPSPSIKAIVDSIRPAVEAAKDEANVLEAAIELHVKSVTRQLRSTAPILDREIEAGHLMIVGAEYHLSSALVTILDGAPDHITAAR